MPCTMSEHVQLCLAFCRIGLYTVGTHTAVSWDRTSGTLNQTRARLNAASFVAVQRCVCCILQRGDPSSGCPRSTVAWLLNGEYTLMYSSRVFRTTPKSAAGASGGMEMRERKQELLLIEAGFCDNREALRSALTAGASCRAAERWPFRHPDTPAQQ